MQPIGEEEENERLDLITVTSSHRLAVFCHIWGDIS
jgi:hypothetical protein